MSISRYIVVAVVRCSRACSRLLGLSRELAEAEVTVGDERAHAQLGRERERLPVRVPGLLGPALIDLGGLVGVDVAEQFQTPGFPAPLLVGARQRHRLLRLLPRLGDPSEDEIGLGQERDEPRTEAQHPHRRDRFDRLLQQRHRVGRAPRPEIGGAQGRRDERQREANLHRPAEREAWLQHPGCRRKVPVAQMGVPEAKAGPDLAVGMAGGLGDPQALFPCGDGLGELSQVGQDPARTQRASTAGSPASPKRSPSGAPLTRAIAARRASAARRGSPANQSARPR